MVVIPDVTSLARTLSGKRGVIVLLAVSLETVSHGACMYMYSRQFPVQLCWHHWVRLSCRQQKQLPMAFEHWEIVGWSLYQSG